MSRIANRRGIAALGITTLIVAAALLAWQATDSETASAQAPTGGMTLQVVGCTAEPCEVAPGSPFSVAVVASPVPQVPISGFDTEVYFGGLTWEPRATCNDELQVGREDGNPVSQCVADSGPDGEARHVVISEVDIPPLAALAAATGDTLLELDSQCADSGEFTIYLTAVTNGANDAPFGAVYFADDTSQILVTTTGTVTIGATAPRAVADSVTVSCSGTVAVATATPLSGVTEPQPTLVDTGSGGSASGGSSSFALLAVAGVLLAATAAGFGLHRWRSGREA